MQQLTTEPARPLDTGGLHAFNAAGTREILATVEYLGPDGQVTETVSAASQCAIYLEWCQREGVAPDPRIAG